MFPPGRSDHSVITHPIRRQCILSRGRASRQDLCPRRIKEDGRSPTTLYKEGKMKMWAKIGVLVVSVGLALPAAGLNAAEKKESAGAKLFQQHCAACHPGGGNIIKPALTLHKKDMDAHGVKTAKEN